MSEEQTQPVCWLNIPNSEDIDSGMQKLFVKAAEVLGFVPNVFMAYTIRPTHFRHWFDHFRTIMEKESELSRAEREMIGIAVSSENQCLYCLVSHSADLRVLLNDPIKGDLIMLDWRRAGLDERTMAMLEFASKLTISPVDCEEEDLADLRDIGFSEQAVFDIIEIASMFNFTNRLAAGTGMMPNPEYHSIGR